MNLLPFWAVFMPGRIRPTGRIWNWTGHEILLKMGWNSVRLHCMPAWSNWVSSQWIYSHFEQYFMPGRIWNSTGHEILVKLGVNSWIYTQFEQYFRPGRIGYHPNEFTPILSSIHARSNSTGHEILLKMGWNPVRLHCMPAWSNWVSSQWIYSHFEQYFMPGRIRLTGRIRPGMRYWLKWV